jgi:hypothetical protein
LLSRKSNEVTLSTVGRNVTSYLLLLVADVVDVAYVNIVTWSVGCVGVGEVAKGEQSMANQGKEWMGIRATIKKAGFPSK